MTCVTHFRPLRLKLCLLITAVPLLLAGCGNRDAGPSASQVLAKVDGDEISVHQLNHLLGRQPHLANAPEYLRKQALESLIDRQLAYRQAVKEELDRSPEVMLAIEEAKREIIASAYLKKLSAGLNRPTEQAAIEYYHGHPDLFAQRKIYRLRELAIAQDATGIDQAKAALRAGTSIDAMIQALDRQAVRYVSTTVTRPAEQLPIDALARFGAAREGEVIVHEAPAFVHAYQVVESRAFPIDQATALPRIVEFLTNQEGSRTVKDGLARLRQGSKVDYVNGSAPTSSAKVATAVPTGAAPEQAASPAGQALSQDELAKGVSGLK